MKKTLKIILLMIITIFIMTISVFATEFSIGVKMDKQDKEYTLTISLDDIDIVGTGINAFICDLEYDRKIFETVTETDITIKNGWGDFTFNENNGAMLTLRNDFTKQKGEEILEIKLKQKEDAPSCKTEIKITNIQASDSQQDLEAEDQIISLKINGKISRLKTILIVILAILIVLFVLRLIIRTKVKRRKRR